MMTSKKLLTLLLAVCIVLVLYSCRKAAEPTNPLPGGGSSILIWEKFAELDGLSFYSLSSTGSTLAGGDSGRIFRTTNNGNNWQLIQVTPGVGTFHTIIKDIYNLTYAVNDSTGIYRSDNDGITWSKKNSGLKDSAITTIAFTNTGKLIAGSMKGDVYLSADNGETWIRKFIIARPIVASLQSHTYLIFFSAWSDGMYRFAESNLIPTVVNNGLQNNYITSIAVNSSNHIFLGSMGSAVFRSTTNGDEWVHLGSGMTDTTVSSLVIDGHDQIFAGTSGGVFTSVNNGLAWSKIDSGLTSPNVLSLSIDANGFLYAGTNDGIFRSTLSTSVIYNPPTSSISR